MTRKRPAAVPEPIGTADPPPDQAQVQMRKVEMTLSTGRPAVVFIPVDVKPQEIGDVTRAMADVMLNETMNTTPRPSPILIARGRLP